MSLSSSSDLMNVKHDFTSLIQEVQPWILSHFVMWLDLKVAEFKVYGYMLLDQTSNSQHAQISERPVRRADGKLVTKQRVTSDPDVIIIPRSKDNNINGITQNTNFINKRNTGMVPMDTQINKPSDNLQSYSERREAKDNDIENIVTLDMDGFHNDKPSSNKDSLIGSFDKQRKHSGSEYILSSQSDLSPRKKNQSESIPRGLHQSEYISVSGDVTSQNGIESCDTQNNLPLYKSLQFSRVISNNPRNKYRNIDDGLQNLTENECQDNGIQNLTENECQDDGLQNLTENECHDTSNGITSSHLCVDESSEYQSQQLDNFQKYQAMESPVTNQYAEKDSVNHATSDLSLDETTGRVVIKIEDDTDYDQFNCSARVVSPTEDEQDRNFCLSSDQDLSHVANHKTDENSMVYSGTSTVSDGTSLYLVCTNQEETANPVGHPFEYSDGLPKNPFKRMSLSHNNKWKKWIDPETGKYKCSKCNKLFINRSSFYRHQRLHGEKRFHCFMCDKAFHRSEHLRIHIRRHGKMERFDCNYCNKPCDTLQSYQEHVEKCVFSTGVP